MSTRHQQIALAITLALGAPAGASAQQFGSSYLEGGIAAGFVNDVDKSGKFTANGRPLTIETDAGGGAYLTGAWQFRNKLHLFGAYSSGSQELEVRDGASTATGEFDVVRWRIGLGYTQPWSQTLGLYGRLSLDHAAFKNTRVPGVNLDLDARRSGAGGELGVVWAATPVIQVQGHVRYTAVGKVTTDGSNTFDDDILVGVSGRWSFRPDMALVTGYELGKITTWNLGVRFSF